MVQAFDAGVLDGDDEGGGGCVAAADGAEKVLVVVGDGHADDEGRQHVEDEEAVDETIGCLGDVATRCFGFTGGGDDKLGGHDEGEARLDEGVPEGEEAASVALCDERVESARLVPIAEA